MANVSTQRSPVILLGVRQIIPMLYLKEHYHVFAHAQEFDFRTGGSEFKDAGIDIELSQIGLHRPQSTLALP